MFAYTASEAKLEVDLWEKAAEGSKVFLQLITIDRSLLSERVGRLGPKQLAQILYGIDVVLGR